MVELRQLDPARDAERLHTIFGNDKACHFLTQAAFTDIAQTQAMMEERAGYGPQFNWVILAEGDPLVRGRVNVYPALDGYTMHADPPPNAVWEIGIMLCPDSQGRGLAYQACTQAIDRLDAAKAPRRIIADIDPENISSIRLFERLGFIHEGTLRKTWNTHIGVRDTYLMALCDDDTRPWRALANL